MYQALSDKINFNPIIVLFLTKHIPYYMSFHNDFNPIIVLFLTKHIPYYMSFHNDFNPIIVLFLTAPLRSSV